MKQKANSEKKPNKVKMKRAMNQNQIKNIQFRNKTGTQKET
jgi:hypothetical protein